MCRPGSLVWGLLAGEHAELRFFVSESSRSAGNLPCLARFVDAVSKPLMQPDTFTQNAGHGQASRKLPGMCIQTCTYTSMIRTYIHSCMQTYIHMYRYTDTCTCTYTYIRICRYEQLFVHVSICLHIYVLVYVLLDLRSFEELVWNRTIEFMCVYLYNICMYIYIYILHHLSAWVDG